MKFWLYFIGFVLAFQAIKVVVAAAGALVVGVVALCIFVLAIYLLCLAIRAIYFWLNPSAKARHLDEVEKLRREEDFRVAREKAEADAKSAAVAKAEAEAELEASRLRALAIEAARARELKRIALRDGEVQEESYEYKVGHHANEALAYRYGVVNQCKKIKEYYYYGKGGRKIREPDRDSFYFVPANTIRLRKVSRVKNSVYEVELSDYRCRKAKAVIEVGTEYVKTFLPLDEQWHKDNDEFESVMKGNIAFSLKKLAAFHIMKTVKSTADS